MELFFSDRPDAELSNRFPELDDRIFYQIFIKIISKRASHLDVPERTGQMLIKNSILEAAA